MVKSEDNKVLVKDEEIKERWRACFCMLFNMDNESNLALEVSNTEASDRIKYVRNIRVSGTKYASRRKIPVTR